MNLKNILQLRYKEDSIPVIISFLSFLILMASWLWITNPILWGIISMGVLFLPRAMSTTFVHNHAHITTSKSSVVNFLLETILYFIAGMMSSKFKLHHNLGHHLHYLDHEKDPSRWLHKDGKEMSRLFYTLRYYFTHTPLSIKIGMRHKKLLVEYVIQQLWVGGLLVSMFYFKPEATLFLIFIPMTITWLIFITITYDDHVGLYSENLLEASYSKTNPLINKIILNNGYHTMHHLKPGLHWSKLPEQHMKIEDDIPEIPANTSLNKLSVKLEKRHA